MAGRDSRGVGLHANYTLGSMKPMLTARNVKVDTKAKIKKNYN